MSLRFTTGGQIAPPRTLGLLAALGRIALGVAVFGIGLYAAFVCTMFDALLIVTTPADRGIGDQVSIQFDSPLFPVWLVLFHLSALALLVSGPAIAFRARWGYWIAGSGLLVLGATFLATLKM